MQQLVQALITIALFVVRRCSSCSTPYFLQVAAFFAHISLSTISLALHALALFLTSIYCPFIPALPVSARPFLYNTSPHLTSPHLSSPHLTPRQFDPTRPTPEEAAKAAAARTLWSEAVRMLIAFFVMDTWQYFWHRLMHESRFLYR